MQSVTAMVKCIQNGILECSDGLSHIAQQKAPTSRCNACQRPLPHTSNVPVKLHLELDRRQVLQFGAVALCQSACTALPAPAQAAQQHSGAQSSSHVIVKPSSNQTASQYDSYASKGMTSWMLVPLLTPLASPSCASPSSVLHMAMFWRWPWVPESTYHFTTGGKYKS